MSSFTGLFSQGSGGLKPKFQEFTSSGTFTPSQELIDAGGYIEVFLVGGGGSGNSSRYGGTGGETILKQMYLTSTSSITVTIGSGASSGLNGGDSQFLASSAGGADVTSQGGRADGRFQVRFGAGFPAVNNDTEYNGGAGSGVFGYGAGGTASAQSFNSGVREGATNSGQGAQSGFAGGSGYCLVKWYE